MTVVSYTLNDDPLFSVSSLAGPVPTSGAPAGYLSGSFSIDFSNNSLVSSNISFLQPIGAGNFLTVPLSGGSFAVVPFPGGGAINYAQWLSPGISNGNNVISTDSTGYEASVQWPQSAGDTPQTAFLYYIGPQTTIDFDTQNVTGTFLVNPLGPLTAQVLDPGPTPSAPGPAPGAGLVSLGVLLLLLIASGTRKLIARYNSAVVPCESLASASRSA